MGERENIIELAKSFNQRANEKIAIIKVLINEKAYSDAISRSYYACYLMVKGLLLLIGETPKSHSGIITTFGLKFIKTKFIEEKYGKIFKELFDARQTSDYDPIVWYSKEDAEDYFEKTKNFIEILNSQFEKLLQS